LVISTFLRGLIGRGCKGAEMAVILQLCNFLDWRDMKIVYKRYASLYFVCGVDNSDNELLVLEIIHHFVEVCQLL
jgi:AP-1 complex subunit sigma 1/2